MEGNIKVVGVIRWLFLFALLSAAGCEPMRGGVGPSGGRESAFIYTHHYAAEKIDIMPLTEFVSVGDGEETLRLNVYVSLLDSFGCQVKGPAIFRFELYEKVPRSGQPMGGRVVIWPDVDLTDRSENNNYWRDFLRAYEFNLDFGPRSDKSYILQVMCLCPNGRRLSAEFGLGPTK